MSSLNNAVNEAVVNVTPVRVASFTPKDDAPGAGTGAGAPAETELVPTSQPQLQSQKTALGGADYMSYERMLQAAWTDLPDLTVEYRDMSFVRSVPVTSGKIETVLTELAGLAKAFQPKPMRDFPVLHPCNGAVLPGTMTLVLAPPGHGKSTFLKTIGGRYHGDPNLRGSLLFNGMTHDEAQARGLHINRMTAYVDQGDVHMPLLTVRETFQFALENSAADPALLGNPDLAKLHEHKVDLVLELLGLKECENTIIGDEMLRGVSGGQKRRVSIGEMLITNARMLLLDEVTTGLDSAASFDIISAVRQWTRLMRGSCVAALLQPTPECFALFDRLILLRQGTIVYDGPIDRVQSYFESIGIPVPADQDLADFLTDFLNDPKMIYMRALYRRARKVETSQTRPQTACPVEPELHEEEEHKSSANGAIAPSNNAAANVLSSAPDGSVILLGGSSHSKDPVQASFAHQVHPLKARQPSDFRKLSSAVIAPASSATVPDGCVPLSTATLGAAFKASKYHAGISVELARLEAERPKLSAFSKESLTPFTRAQFSEVTSHPVAHHLKSNFERQWKNMVRNTSLIGPRIGQAIFMGLVLGSLFYQLNPSASTTRLGICLFGLVFIAFANQVELPFAAALKLVVFKQADAGFYPVSTYTISLMVVHLALAIPETFLMGTILYYLSGFDENAGRWIVYLIILFVTNLAMSTLFRTFAYITKNQDVAQQALTPVSVLFMLFSGFLITRNNIPDYLIWVYWLSPFSWSFRSVAQNEFFSTRYEGNTGNAALSSFGLQTDAGYKWAGVGFVAFVFLLFGVLSTLALAYKRFPLTTGTRRILADEDADEAEANKPEEQVKLGAPVKMDLMRRYASSYRAKDGSTALPFEPIDLAWRDIKYTVQVKDDHGKTMDRVLLNGVNGFARAGTLTALMGSSGAGKTTLMDVIAGRKTAGKMEGDILINGFVTPPQVFQRLMGYVEQTDIHLATQTVREALRFSARLRLPHEVPDDQMYAFVEEVLDILELTPIADRIIGDVSLPGLSPGQMKRVTIGVELVANPPLLFLDEPTSGLDSRAALIVMRVVKRIAQTGRAVVCTIHQPSAELFYMFDRLLLLRSGGMEVFFGDLGEFGANLVEYFESAPVKEDFRYKLPPRTNPASWMLEVIGAGTGAKLKAKGYTKADLPDYADVYKQSKLREENMTVLQEVSQPKAGAKPLRLEGQYASTTLMQFQLVVARMFQFYWRSPGFITVRLYLMLFLGILFGILYLDIGQSDTSALVSKLSATFLCVSLPGMVVCGASLPILCRQRAVYYRERASIMYMPYAYALSLTLAELVYTTVACVVFLIPAYFLIGFQNDGSLFFKFFLAQLLCALIFSYMGQVLAVALPNQLLAMNIMGLLMTFSFLFAGVFIQPDKMPAAWKWVHTINWIPKALIAVGVTQFECTGEDWSSDYCSYVDGVRVDRFTGDYLSTGFGMYWPYIGWLCLTIFVMRVLCDFSLAFINHQKR